MQVWYVHKSTERGATQMANILWKGRWKMQNGEFPPEHPCLQNAEAFEAFKGRGYWANPFPEGDGITLDPLKDQSAEQVIQDIRESLGWDVKEGAPPLRG